MRIPTSWQIYRTPAVIALLWLLLVLLLFHWVIWRENLYTKELARLQTETLFSSIVNARAWNADNGGVWVEESSFSPANPWIPEAMRTQITREGKKLVKINPAYMTRQLAERMDSRLVRFRISSLVPKRPENRPDSWEKTALTVLHSGEPACFALEKDVSGALFRFMAPLNARAACLQCHTTNREGDILGGISVSISAEPLLQAARGRKHTAALAFGLVGLAGMAGIGGATLQLNRKREQAEAANRTKSAFLANMTHDMRTPLAGMIGMAELLEREAASPRQGYLLRNLREAADALLGLVDEIMRYSLLEADVLRAGAAPLALRAELEQCLNAFRPACDARGITLSCTVDGDAPDALEGDAFHLRQALGNVLGNAVKFTRRGEVALHVSVDQLMDDRCLLCFRVRDTGVGIAPDERQRIFERFEQGAAAGRDTDRQTGIGLGLSVSRRIARVLGGDLVLESSSAGGSVFVLRGWFGRQKAFDAPLPPASGNAASAVPMRAAARPAADDAPTQAPPVPRTAPAAHAVSDAHPLSAPAVPRPRSTLRGQCVLVAEDTPVNAVFIQEVLGQAGYDVHVANCGQDALHLLGKLAPQAAVLDMRLPDLNGDEIAARIRAGEAGVRPDLPVLVLTASLLPADENRLRALRVDAWLNKPVQAARLLAVLAALLEHPAAPAAQCQAMPMGEGHPEPDTRVFDLSAALDTVEGKEALLRQLCGLFLAEAGHTESRLTATLADVPAPEARATLRCLAHSLKNNAGTLCLTRLRDTAACLEKDARTLPPDALATLVRATAEALQEAAKRLDAYLKEQV